MLLMLRRMLHPCARYVKYFRNMIGNNYGSAGANGDFGGSGKCNTPAIEDLAKCSVLIDARRGLGTRAAGFDRDSGSDDVAAAAAGQPATVGPKRSHHC